MIVDSGPRVPVRASAGAARDGASPRPVSVQGDRPLELLLVAEVGELDLAAEVEALAAGRP